MAGKRVRCKQCGNIFALPDASFEEDMPDLDAWAEAERSFHSVDATDAGGSAVRDGGDEGDSEYSEEAAPLRRGRSNVRFRFPLAGELDIWLPRVLMVGGLAWLISLCLKRTEPNTTGLTIARLAAALIAFFVFIGPITLMMIRKAGRQLGYQMPTGDRWRTYAAYFPAFVLGYAMCLASGGQLKGLILGCVGGAILATVFLWLFFRLGPAEIAPSATYAFVGFFIGLAVVSGIFLGLNTLILQLMISMKNPDLLPASPFAPSQAIGWLSEDQRLELLAAKEKESRPTPRPGETSDGISVEPAPPPPPPPPELSPIVRSIQTAPLEMNFEQFIRPMTESNFRAIARTDSGNVQVQVWNIETSRQTGSTSFALGQQQWENQYVLSPDGNLLARVSEFPRLQVQVWNFSARQVTHFINLTERRGVKPELVGFVDPQRLLIRWQSGGGCTIEIRDIAAPAADPRLVELPSFELNGTTLVFGRQATLAAVATRVNQSPTLLVYSLESGQKVSEVTIESMDPRWPVTPTGMDFSADGTQVAMLFEQSGNGLLLSYQIDQPEGKKINEYVYPAGPIRERGPVAFQGSSVKWLPDGKSWLLYGQAVFSVSTGQRIEGLEVPDVERAFVSADRVELVTRTGGKRELQIVKLDLEKIAAMSVAR